MRIFFNFQQLRHVTRLLRDLLSVWMLRSIFRALQNDRLFCYYIYVYGLMLVIWNFVWVHLSNHVHLKSTAKGVRCTFPLYRLNAFSRHVHARDKALAFVCVCVCLPVCFSVCVCVCLIRYRRSKECTLSCLDVRWWLRTDFGCLCCNDIDKEFIETRWSLGYTVHTHIPRKYTFDTLFMAF